CGGRSGWCARCATPATTAPSPATRATAPPNRGAACSSSTPSATAGAGTRWRARCTARSCGPCSVCRVPATVRAGSPGDVGQGIAAPPFYARHRLSGHQRPRGPRASRTRRAVGPSCGAAAVVWSGGRPDRQRSTVSRLPSVVSRPSSAGDQVVELAVLHTQQHRLDLRTRVDECGTVGEAGIAHRHVPAGQPGELHAGSLRVAVPALLPGHAVQRGGRHAVVHAGRVGTVVHVTVVHVVVHRSLPGGALAEVAIDALVN